MAANCSLLILPSFWVTDSKASLWKKNGQSGGAACGAQNYKEKLFFLSRNHDPVTRNIPQTLSWAVSHVKYTVTPFHPSIYPSIHLEKNIFSANRIQVTNSGTLNPSHFRLSLTLSHTCPPPLPRLLRTSFIHKDCSLEHPWITPSSSSEPQDTFLHRQQRPSHPINASQRSPLSNPKSTPCQYSHYPQYAAQQTSQVTLRSPAHWSTLTTRWVPSSLSWPRTVSLRTSLSSGSVPRKLSPSKLAPITPILVLTPKSQITSSSVKHPERLLTSETITSALLSGITAHQQNCTIRDKITCYLLFPGCRTNSCTSSTRSPLRLGARSLLFVTQILSLGNTIHRHGPPFPLLRWRCPTLRIASTPSTPPHHLPALKSGMQANNRQTHCNKSELIIIDPQSVSRTISAFLPQHLHQFILSHPPSCTCSQPSDPFFERVPNISKTGFWPTHLLVLIFRGMLTSHSIWVFFCKAGLNFFCML